MPKINIYSPAGVLICSVDKVISSSFSERLDGERIFEFTANQKMLAGVDVDSKIEFAGQYYNVTRILRSMSDGACLVTVTAEQETMSFADDELTNWQASGTPTQVLSNLLVGTGVSVGVVEYSGQILSRAHSSITRRAAIIEIANITGLELEYSGHTLSLLRRGRRDAAPLRNYCRVIDIAQTIDMRSGSEAYEVEVDSAKNLSLGDMVTVDYTPLGVSKSKRIVGISYDPFNCDSVSLEIGDYVPNVSEDYANDKVTARDEAESLAETLARFELNMGENSADIELLTKWQTSAEDELEGLVQSVAVLEMESDANGASISQIVEAVGDDGEVTAASIVTAVNRAGSGVKINADAIDIAGAMGGLTLSASGTGEVESNIATFMNGPDLFDNVVYGFTKTSDGYYTSTNGGIDNSFSYAAFLINNTASQTSKKIILRCISYGENNYDYGVVSKLGSELAHSSDVDDDSNNNRVLKSFKGESSQEPVDITLNIPAGTYDFITFKYRKDGSQSNDGDYFKIKVIDAESSGDENSSMISLMYNGMVLSSANINIKGFVTFQSLENDGETTVNGNNISLILDAANDNGRDDVESISSLAFKYRYSSGGETVFANILTEISGEDADTTSRYALKLRTEQFYNDVGDPVYPAIKLLSAGRASIEAMAGIFLGTEYIDGAYIQLDAYENTRIMAHKTYAKTHDYYDSGYCFCTDGIYYNGRLIVST